MTEGHTRMNRGRAVALLALARRGIKQARIELSDLDGQIEIDRSNDELRERRRRLKSEIRNGLFGMESLQDRYELH